MSSVRIEIKDRNNPDAPPKVRTLNLYGIHWEARTEELELILDDEKKQRTVKFPKTTARILAKNILNKLDEADRRGNRE